MPNDLDEVYNELGGPDKSEWEGLHNPNERNYRGELTNRTYETRLEMERAEHIAALQATANQENPLDKLSPERAQGAK